MTDAGRYRVLKRIGAGGMAEVLEAIAVGDHGFERRVAIKRMFPSDRVDAGALAAQRRFLDEARIAAQLHHANIVAVTDYGIADGQPFQVLEHVDGIDVGGLVALATTLPVELALYITAMVGQALDYVHDATGADDRPLGIVHRDVTPGNVLVSWSGDVRLTDFGIAFAHQRVETTLAGTTKGTPTFMAPEQMLAGEIDRRTDLFSLGCTLHVMVTGRSPLSADDERTQLASGHELVLDAALPSDVRAIVARCTRYARRDRYANAGELVAAVTTALGARGAIDPRTALRDWLRRLTPLAPAPAAPPPARGKLDALLEMDLVFAQARDGVRTFTAAGPTLGDRPRAKAAAPMPPAPIAIAPSPPSPPPVRARRRRWLPAAAALVVAGGAAAAIGVSIAARAHASAATTGSSYAPPPNELLEGLSTWTSKHPVASQELAAWSHAHPAAASALFTWAEARPSGIVQLVEWATDHPGASIAEFGAARPAWPELAALLATHEADDDRFLAWARRYPVAAMNLSHRPRVLIELGHELAP